MSRYCHETGRYLENPFYALSLVIKDQERIAFSDVETNIGASAFSWIKDYLKKELADIETKVAFALNSVGGGVGGITGTVQIAGSYLREMDYRFLNPEIVKEKLPKSYATLQKEPTWVQHVDGQWKDAAWADEVYQRLIHNSKHTSA